MAVDAGLSGLSSTVVGQEAGGGGDCNKIERREQIQRRFGHMRGRHWGWKVVLVGPTTPEVIAPCVCTILGVGGKRAGMPDRNTGTGVNEGGRGETSHVCLRCGVGVCCFDVWNPWGGDRSGVAWDSFSWLARHTCLGQEGTRLPCHNSKAAWSLAQVSNQKGSFTNSLQIVTAISPTV